MEYLDTGLFKVIISLRLLKEKFEGILKTSNPAARNQAQEVLLFFDTYPALIAGTASKDEFLEYKAVIDQLMVSVFPPVLTSNEIKAAVFPYSNELFYCSGRLRKIIDNANTTDNIFNDLFKDNEDSFDLLGYAIILNSYYNYEVDFDRPKTISVTDKKGIRKRYRVTFNADFLDIYPNENAIEITPDILTELLSKTHDKQLWDKYFPKESWTIEGFGLINLIDTSLDEQIDDFKSHLIKPNKDSFQFLVSDIRRIFKLPDLKLGSYSVDNNQLVPPYDRNFEMLTLSPLDSVSIDEYACNHINTRLFKEHKPVTIANVELYHKQTGGNRLSKQLLERGLKSIALIPIPIKGKLRFIIELGTTKVNQLNPINMVKLETIMPFILSYSKRSVTEYENEISAVIQNECTSIHPSVQWRFEQEANKYIQERNYGDSPVFDEIVFKDVLPLYGQVDIVGSSKARNDAILSDLTTQLNLSKDLIQKRIKDKDLPFYEQLIYQIDKFLFELNEGFHANSEQEVNIFFENKIFPLFEYLVKTSNDSDDIEMFLGRLDKANKTLYHERKKYDVTVSVINKILSNFIDKEQVKAQDVFPHYFEKFKTDGIEHNIYIGQSLVKNLEFHPSALYNLRLWQLQVTCEMEAMYYHEVKDFPVRLEVASLILAYDVPITIRYRMDEKQFDVDGAYNVRYEMIKKRIDKAHIKNTKERLTQPYKLCVVYSSNVIEREYLAYFEFLQAKNYVGQNLEIVELEELQEASGIKAIRVDLNHNLKKADNFFKVEDLHSL